MILSHGIKGLLDFSQFPPWGLVPVHLVTKVSSSLFILVFGVSLAAGYLPAVGTARWSEKRKRLLVRGLVVLFWYKLLTIAEMAHLHRPEEIIDALLYRGFPVFAEILGFYAIALLWVPWFLPLWKRASGWLRLFAPILAGALAVAVSRNFDFGSHDSIRALLVEDERHYTWGQLSRGPLVLGGLLLGGWLARAYGERGRRRTFAVSTGAAALLLLVWLAADSGDALYEQLVAIARNDGKHPPELHFLLFSLGGALLALSLAVAGGEPLARALAPLRWLGTNALPSFVFHLFVLFVFYRYLLGYWHAVPYPTALALTGLLLLLTVAWTRIVVWVRRNS